MEGNLSSENLILLGTGHKLHIQGKARSVLAHCQNYGDMYFDKLDMVHSTLGKIHTRSIDLGTLDKPHNIQDILHDSHCIGCHILDIQHKMDKFLDGRDRLAMPRPLVPHILQTLFLEIGFVV